MANSEMNVSMSKFFSSLQDAQMKIKKWRIDYNINRPHSGINKLTPQKFFNLSKKNNI